MNCGAARRPPQSSWASRDLDIGGGATYTEWLLNGKSIGGGIQMDANFPPNLPSNWLTYFTVANTENSVKRAQELGGKVLVPPTTIPQGSRLSAWGFSWWLPPTVRSES